MRSRFLFWQTERTERKVNSDSIFRFPYPNTFDHENNLKYVKKQFDDILP